MQCPTVKYKERHALKQWLMLLDSWKSLSTSHWLTHCQEASPQGCRQPARLCTTPRNWGGCSEGSPPHYHPGAHGLLVQTFSWVHGEHGHLPPGLGKNCQRQGCHTPTHVLYPSRRRNNTYLRILPQLRASASTLGCSVLWSQASMI